MLSEEEKQAIDFLINKRGEVYRLMRFEDTNNYILAKKEFNNYCIIEELISNSRTLLSLATNGLHSPRA